MGLVYVGLAKIELKLTAASCILYQKRARTKWIAWSHVSSYILVELQDTHKYNSTYTQSGMCIVHTYGAHNVFICEQYNIYLFLAE